MTQLLHRYYRGTCYRSSSRQCARHDLPNCRGRASRIRCDTGCTPCACSPGLSLWAACTWGRAWCLPRSSWHSHSLRCSCAATCSQSHSPPMHHPHSTVQTLAKVHAWGDAARRLQRPDSCAMHYLSDMKQRRCWPQTKLAHAA